MSTLKPALTFLVASIVAVLTAFGPTASVPAGLGPVSPVSAERKLPASGMFADASEKKAAVDITDVYFSAASKAEPAAVSVFTNDAFEIGDAFAVTLNIDGDAAPDVLITGMYASEYGVYLLKDWGKTGKNITGKNCARMTIDGKYADASFSPNCFTGKTVSSFSANVRTLGDGGSDDYAPGFQKFTKKIDANI